MQERSPLAHRFLHLLIETHEVYDFGDCFFMRKPCNPYDPCDEMYGELLRQKRMVKTMHYQKEWVKLYSNQLGVCALCGYEMDIDTGWHDHHIEYRVNGGSNGLGNRVLLHPNCHAQAHSLGLKIVKPASV